MSDVWGLMPKSQVDDETIEEAIDRLIAVHEAEPTSHMGDGESIDVHRKNTVIDHPAGSAVADKLSMTEFNFIPSLYDSTFWSTIQNNGVYDEGNRPGVIVGIDDVSQYCRREGTLNGLSDFLNYDKDMLVQFNMVVNEHDDYYAFLGQLYYNGTSFLAGFGFEIDDDVLLGFYVASGGLEYTDVIAFTPGDLTNLRAQYNAYTRDLSFYVNGELAETLTVAGDAPTSGGGKLLFGMKSKTGAPFAMMDVFDIYYSRSI